MRKLIFLLSLPILLISEISAQDPTNHQKIGIARFNYIITKLPEMKSIETELLEFQEQLNQMYDSKVKAYELKYGEYQNKLNQLPEVAIKSFETDLIQMQESIKKFKIDAQYSLVDKQNNLMKPIRQKVFDSIDQIANEFRFSLILNYDIDELPVVLHYNDSLDISDTVLSRLGVEE